MRIGLDLDEVLCDFLVSFLDHWNKKHGTLFTREQFKTYKLEDTLGCTSMEFQEELEAFNKSSQFFYMQPVSYARELVRDLKKKHELFIATARPEKLREATLAWLNFHFGGFSDVVFALDYNERPKARMAKWLGLNVAIEDNPTHALDLASADIPVIVPACPWNINHQYPDGVSIHKVEYSGKAISKKVEELSRMHLNGYQH